MDTLTVHRSLDGRGKTITTFVVHEATQLLAEMAEGEVLEILTDAFEPFRHDVPTWCRAVGHRLIATDEVATGYRFVLEKGPPQPPGKSLAMVISDGGLTELLTPFGFALAAALEGMSVHLYVNGPAVKMLARGYRPRLRGWGRPFSRFAAAGLARTGHVSAQEKLRQILALGGRLYVCGPSLEHFKVKQADLAFPDRMIVEYLTFMAVMRDADVQVFA